MNGGKAKSIKETESTLRFHLQLDNPTDETTNEFLYSELTSEKSRKVSIHGTDRFILYYACLWNKEGN